jgi:hypothetical protein
VDHALKKGVPFVEFVVLVPGLDPPRGRHLGLEAEVDIHQSNKALEEESGAHEK